MSLLKTNTDQQDVAPSAKLTNPRDDQALNLSPEKQKKQLDFLLEDTYDSDPAVSDKPKITTDIVEMRRMVLEKVLTSITDEDVKETTSKFILVDKTPNRILIARYSELDNISKTMHFTEEGKFTLTKIKLDTSVVEPEISKSNEKTNPIRSLQFSGKDILIIQANLGNIAFPEDVREGVYIMTSLTETSINIRKLNTVSNIGSIITTPLLMEAAARISRQMAAKPRPYLINLVETFKSSTLDNTSISHSGVQNSKEVSSSQPNDTANNVFSVEEEAHYFFPYDEDNNEIIITNDTDDVQIVEPSDKKNFNQQSRKTVFNNSAGLKLFDGLVFKDGILNKYTGDTTEIPVDVSDAAALLVWIQVYSGTCFFPFLLENFQNNNRKANTILNKFLKSEEFASTYPLKKKEYSSFKHDKSYYHSVKKDIFGKLFYIINNINSLGSSTTYENGGKASMTNFDHTYEKFMKYLIDQQGQSLEKTEKFNRTQESFNRVRQEVQSSSYISELTATGLAKSLKLARDDANIVGTVQNSSLTTYGNSATVMRQAVDFVQSENASNLKAVNNSIDKVEYNSKKILRRVDDLEDNILKTVKKTKNGVHENSDSILDVLREVKQASRANAESSRQSEQLLQTLINNTRLQEQKISNLESAIFQINSAIKHAPGYTGYNKSDYSPEKKRQKLGP